MSRWHLAVILAVAITWDARTAYATDEVALVGDTHCDVVFFGNEGLTVMRLTVRMDGLPIARVLDDYVHGLFRRFDANQDGQLEPTERETFRAITDILSMVTGPQPVVWELSPDQSSWQPEKFSAYVKSKLGRSIQVIIQNPPQDARLETPNSRLFQALDADQDGKLEPSELSLPKRMLRRDWNEDDSLSIAELFPDLSNPIAFPNRVARTSPINAIQILIPNTADSSFVRQLISKYDRTWNTPTGDQKRADFMLSSEELSIAPDLLSPFDHDQKVIEAAEVETAVRGIEISDPIRDERASATDVEDAPPAQTGDAVNVVETQRIDVVQRLEFGAGIPPAVRELAEFLEIERIDVDHRFGIRDPGKNGVRANFLRSLAKSQARNLTLTPFSQLLIFSRQ